MSADLSRRAFFTGSPLADAAPRDPYRRNVVIAMFLTLLALVFPLNLMEEYCGERVRAADLNSFDAAMKELYADDRVRELLYAETPWFARLAVKS